MAIKEAYILTIISVLLLFKSGMLFCLAQRTESKVNTNLCPFNTFPLQANAIKCFECFSKEECDQKHPPLVECNHTSILTTSSHFYFLPNVMNQVPSLDFYCGLYTGHMPNNTLTTLKGCFYSTYNPCSFVTTDDLLNMEFRCKYCNLYDGCNSSGSLLMSVSLLMFTTMLNFLLNK